MLKTILLFKRHFYKCKDVVEVLGKNGNFGLNIHIENGLMQGKIFTPDDEITIRFIVVLRRFLTPSDPLYYRRVWNQLHTVFSHDIPQELTNAITAFEHKFPYGQFNLVVDNVECTAEQIYELISQCTYFDEDTRAKEVLQQLTANPMTKLLFWSQFYSYSMDGFRIVSLIFEAIKCIQNSTKYKKLVDGTRLAHPQCIYCLSTDKPFTSEEHIFPESLGNEELLLPKGYVCDECNNELLSGLDNYLVNFEPIAFLRVNFVSYDKQGRLPKANFQNMVIEKTHPRHLKFIPKDKTGRMKNEKDLGDGWFSWQMSMKGKRPDMKKVGRALYKIALGTIALEQGPVKVLDNKYDIVRAFIRGNSDFSNNLLLKMNCQPHPQVRITYYDLPEGMPFEIDIFGMQFLLNLALTPIMQPSDMLRELGFEAFPLFD